MKENKHIEKELLFKTNIKDITSISLDSEYKIEDNSIVGNFLINGEYKIHEVSINREKFDFKIPFKHEIEDDIDRDSIELEITNFTYDYKKDELIVNIDYDLLGNRVDVLEFDNRESLDDFLKTKEVEVIDTRIDDIKEIIDENKLEQDKKSEEESDRQIEENIIENNDIENEDLIAIQDNESDLKEEALDDKLDLIDDCNKIEIKEANIDLNDNINEIREKINTEDILNKISEKTDGFITYKVYKLKENENLESIVIKYHTTIDELKEYNDLDNLNIGDKIIIPKYE